MDSGKRRIVSSRTAKSSKKLRGNNESADLGYESQLPSCSYDLDSLENSSSSITQAEVGIIEKVSVTNFMCHSKLDFNFGANINFVIGQNGSGKSAVLTAIVVGLGGKANATNRGTSIKNFIKTGHSFAVVEVHLRNQGPDAFKPDEYGSMIIVERKILKDGASTYKIKAINEKVISTKKEELLAILDQFNIQVDNPVAVLNQKTSRDFLSSKLPKDKYTFFLKATQLDQIKQSNTDAAEKLQLAADMLARKKDMLPQLERDVEEWEERWRFVQCMDNLREFLTKLKREYAWSIVIAKEIDCQQVYEDYQNKVKDVDILESEAQKLNDSAKKKKQKQMNLKKKLDGIVKDMETLKNKDEGIKLEISRIKSEMRPQEFEKRKAINEISSLKSDEQLLTNQLQEIIKSEPEDHSVEKELRNKQIAAYKETLREYVAEKETKDVHLNNLKGSRLHYDAQKQQVQLECIDIRSKMQKLEKKIFDLEGSRKNRFQNFGQHMPALVDNIEKMYKKGQFQKKPVGPLAAYIKLRDPKWALAVETCLANFLEAFCCDNYKDEKVLLLLMNSIFKGARKPTVIVGEFENHVYDVSRYRVSCHPHSNILDMLVIENPAIVNTLIDNKNIESILLVENRSEARHIMTYNVPRNCRECFTIEGDQVFPAPSFRFYSNSRPVSKYLKGNVEERVMELKELLKNEDLVLKEKQQLQNEALNNMRKNKEQIEITEKQVARISQSIGHVNAEINNLLNFVEPEPVDVTSLEEEVKQLQDKQLQLTQHIEALEESIVKAKTKTESLRVKRQENEQKTQELVNDAEPVREEIDRLCKCLSEEDHIKQAQESKLKQSQLEVKMLKNKLDELKQETTSMNKNASEVCDRMETDRTPVTINSQMQEITKKLKQEEERQGNKEEVSKRCCETKTRLKKIKNEISECDEMMKKIEIGVQERQKRFASFRSELVIRINYLFNATLNTRKFTGSMKFNHKQRTLILQVQPNVTVKQLCNDIRSLSGGERSFSTVCFIISLWNTMESPFRILDEYDVFMDMVNRRISMDMMMDVAKTKRCNQFIFLTPLEMTKIDAAGLVKICRMPDPERRIMQKTDEENE